MSDTKEKALFTLFEKIQLVLLTVFPMLLMVAMVIATLEFPDFDYLTDMGLPFATKLLDMGYVYYVFLINLFLFLLSSIIFKTSISKLLKLDFQFADKENHFFFLYLLAIPFIYTIFDLSALIMVSPKLHNFYPLQLILCILGIYLGCISFINIVLHIHPIMVLMGSFHFFALGMFMKLSVVSNALTTKTRNAEAPVKWFVNFPVLIVLFLIFGVLYGRLKKKKAS